MTFTGLALSFGMTYLMGVGLASGTFTNPDWDSTYKVSAGALLLAGYNGLGGFGKFCGVILALGLVRFGSACCAFVTDKGVVQIANNIPRTYSAALGFQIMGRRLTEPPRWLWVCICVLIYTACTLGGRNNLFSIFENFLALMGYWVTFFLAIVIEEDLLFQRKGYN